jgi:Na+/melibiose symporter-like transporter
MKFNYGKIFLLGFGFFGVSVIWGMYNAFVPIFLADRFHLSPIFIGFFMTLDNIAALFIQPPVGAWSDRIRTKIGRRLPFILIGAPISALAFGLIPMQAVLPLFVACISSLILTMALWRTPVVALGRLLPSRPAECSTKSTPISPSGWARHWSSLRP